MSAPPRQITGLQRLAAGMILVLAVGVRLSDPPSQFRLGRLVPVDADSAMHYRRAYLWATQAPWPPVVDPLLGYPDGAAVHWSPGWSAALGAFGWLVSGGRPGSTAYDIGLAVFPLLVGVLSIWLAMRLAWRIWGARAGLVAGLCAAIIPQHVAATQFGRLDHNAAEAFFLIAMASEAARERPRTWALALLVAGVCLAWVGGFAYVAIGAAALLLAALVSPGEPARPFARAGIPGLLLGAALLAPVALKNGFEAGHPFYYAFLSGFQPAWLVAVALGSAWILALVCYPRWRRWLLLVGGALLAAAAVTVGPVAAEGVEQWLVRENPWLATVQEMNPILKGPGWDPASWEVALLVLGRAYPLVPPLALWLAWRAWRGRGPARPAGGTLAVLFCAVVAWGLTHLQVRFGWTCAPLMAAVLGGALARVPFGIALVPLIFLRPGPVLAAAYLNPKTQRNQHPWTFQAYYWLGEQAPPVDPAAPTDGVLARWWHGHWITVLGHHPQYIGHFGNYAGGIGRYYETQAMLDGDGESLTALMKAQRLRYLLLDSSEAMETQGPLRQLLVAGGAGESNPAQPGLRAVFASLADPGVPYEGVPGTWIYERVAGARVTGHGAPRQPVELTVPLFYSGQWRAWTARTQVDEGGLWRLVVPYWTDADGFVPTGERATAVVGERRLSFEIPELAVREGAELRLGKRWGAPSGPLRAAPGR